MDGYIKIKDRSKDIIISGGENISSVEVEDVLYRHPAVLAAAVVAQPDEKWGETPCAFVELKEGANIDAAELTAFCRATWPASRCPRRSTSAAAQDLHRQDPEVRTAQAHEVGQRHQRLRRRPITSPQALRARCDTGPRGIGRSVRQGARRLIRGSRRRHTRPTAARVRPADGLAIQVGGDDEAVLGDIPADTSTA
jgi:hypothetical protein